MTAEIAILNRQGVALAADSAVTIGRQRVWKSANKLFSMAPFNDIAIMAYGSGDFISYPWETVVKSFRLSIGSRRYKTTRECAEAFIDYLRSDTFRAPSDESVSIMLVFINLLERIKKQLGTYETKKEFRTLLGRRIDLEIDRVGKIPESSIALTYDEFKEDYAETVQKLSKDIFKEHIPQHICHEIIKLCYEAFRRNVQSAYYTGIVFAGFGTDEFFPCVLNYVIDGKNNGALRAWLDESKSHNLNDPEESKAAIIPFA